MLKKFREFYNRLFPEPIIYLPQTVEAKDDKYQMRVMRPDDVPTVLSLERSIYLNTPWDKYAFLSEMQKQGRTLYLVCTEEDTDAMVGYIGGFFHGEHAHITILAVAPIWQQRGIGRMMMNLMINFAKQRGCTYLTLEVAVDNAPAIALYHSLGFADGRIRKNYYTEERKDAMDMRKELDSVTAAPDEKGDTDNG